MAFQFDEKLMAPNRAIITRNLTLKDLEEQDPIKNKPGMMHYIQDSRRLFLSISPIKYTGINGEVITKSFIEIKTELNDDSSELSKSEYVKRVGGQSYSFTGSIYSDVTLESPFNVKSNILNVNLNADLLDGFHASRSISNNTIPVRDAESNIAVKNKLNFADGYIESISGAFNFSKSIKSLNYIGTTESSSKESKLKWDGTDWLVEIDNSDYKVLTTKVMDKLNIYGANIVSQSDEPQDVINENTYWFQIVN